MLILNLLPRLAKSKSILNPHPIGNDKKSPSKAIEAGAGVGRITSDVLFYYVDHVDLLEPVEQFTTEASRRLKDHSKVNEGCTFNINQIGLQHWNPNVDEKYDLIWSQWCLPHLSDEELIEYLKKCKKILKTFNQDEEEFGQDGLIIVKENICNDDDYKLFDDDDSSITRSNKAFLDIFEKSDLNIIHQEIQSGFPRELLKVKTYALR